MMPATSATERFCVERVPVILTGSLPLIVRTTASTEALPAPVLAVPLTSSSASVPLRSASRFMVLPFRYVDRLTLDFGEKPRRNAPRPALVVWKPRTEVLRRMSLGRPEMRPVTVPPVLLF